MSRGRLLEYSQCRVAPLRGNKQFSRNKLRFYKFVAGIPEAKKTIKPISPAPRCAEVRSDIPAALAALFYKVDPW